MPENRLLQYLATLLVGASGGLLATWIHWPLPWMVGSLVAVALVRCTFHWLIPPLPGGRKAGQWGVGIGIGFHFNAYVIEQIAANFAVILAGALVTTAAGALAVWWMRRGGEDSATAFFSSMPGGSAEMVNLGLRNGAVLHRVAAAQTLRVILVVLTVPALFKFLMGAPVDGAPVAGTLDWQWLALIFPLGGAIAWGLQRLRQPNPWLFGPLFVSAGLCSVLDLHLRLPAGASELAQLLIGSSLGCYFDRSFFKGAPRFIARSMTATLLMGTVAFVSALGLGWLAGIDFQSLTLGMMLGGIAEMSLTAETLKLAVPLVTAMQTLRLLVVILMAEPVFRWLRNRESEDRL